MKRRGFIIVVMLVLAGMAVMGVGASIQNRTAQAPAQTASGLTIRDGELAALEIETQLNRWRVENGKWPLQPSDTLRRMARDQVNYLLSGAEMPDNLQAGRNGESPADRAILDPYFWPYYSRTSRTAIGENAGIGGVTFVMNYWANSQIHKDTALSNEYREMGVAALPYRQAFLVIAVFGSRPNVLTAVADSAGGRLYLTREEYRFAQGAEFIHVPTQYRLFDAAGRPLGNGWQTWQANIPIPEGAGDHLFLLYSDGVLESLAYVDLTLRTGTSGEIPAIAATPLQASSPTFVSPNLSLSTSTPTLAAVETQAPQPMPPTQTPLPSGDLLLAWDARSFSGVNIGSGPIDVSQLTIVSPANELLLRFSRWADFSRSPLNALPAGWCVQVHGWDIAAPPAAAQCRNVSGVTNISPDRKFWTYTDFTVMNGTQSLGTCSHTLGQCVVDLP
jgi:uncharacterized protein YkwD